jgi:sugar O-acyltransferase (sialic acid O-acetyltransferase NeuD family)
MKRDTVVVGAGGHGREVVEILHDADQHPIGYVDDDPSKQGTVLNGLPVLGYVDWLREVDVKAICAVGDPEICEKLARRVKGMGLSLDRAISPRAFVSPTATLGEGAIVFPNVVVGTEAKIGNCVTLNVGSTVSHDSTVGDYSVVNPGVHLAGNVNVGRGVFVGMGASIIQCVRLGDRSVIGAGAVVIRDVPALTRALGVPAIARPHR